MSEGQQSGGPRSQQPERLPGMPPRGTFPVENDSLASRVMWGTIDLLFIASVFVLFLTAVFSIVGHL